MLFNSYGFLLYFLPISFAAYYLLGHLARIEAAKLWLVAASFVFYGWWNAGFVALLAVSIALNYLLSLGILAAEEQPARQRWLLTLGVTANLGALVYYKYLFAILGFAHSTGLLAADYGEVILPLGISFFTFTQIGYLVDCQQGLVRERGLLNYSLFVTFFPHLIAGPILHHREIMPQFASDATYRLNAGKVASGFTLFVLGLAKKVLLADQIAPYADAGFGHVSRFGLLTSWSTVLAYSMQLYFDFSGYSDMAVGLGAMFGVSLPINFNSPYKSKGVIDFWQRWHMTLTRYLTLLLYNPISLWVTRRRMARGLKATRQAAETPAGFAEMIVFPTFVTIFLAGVWHGAGFVFIIFGVLHAIYLSVNHAWRIFARRPSKAPQPAVITVLNRIWPVMVTYLCVLVAQVFFRADSTSDALRLLGGAIGLNGWEFPLPVRGGSFVKFGPLADALVHGGLIQSGSIELYDQLTKPLLYNVPVIAGLMLLAWATPNTYQILGTWNPSLQKVTPMRWRLLQWQPNRFWAVIVGVLLFAAMTQLDRPGRFLYFQF